MKIDGQMTYSGPNSGVYYFGLVLLLNYFVKLLTLFY